MKNKKALEVAVRRSKRQLGADASPVEIPVRKNLKKKATKMGTDKAVNEDHMVDKQDGAVEDQIHETAEEVQEEDVETPEEDVETPEEEDVETPEEDVETPEEEDVETPEEDVETPEEEEADPKQQDSRGEEDQPQQAENKIKRKRGPTKMRKLAKEAMEKVDVDFSVIGEHSGAGSVTLSSFLGPLVREHVSVLVDDWRTVDIATKDTMWEEIQARFKLDERSQRNSVEKQMGAIWRSSKSRLVGQLRKTNSATERLKLKPSNIHSLASWNNWVKSRTSTTFKVKSDKYRDLRKSQIPHTTSQKGMFRLSMEMKKKSSDPRKVTRSKVWLAGHTYSDGRPVKKEFAEFIERI